MNVGFQTLAQRGVSSLADYWELTKPEVNSLVVVSSAAGYCVAATAGMDWLRLAHVLVGTALVSGGTAAFNQVLERDADALMRRTAQRPVPAGRLEPRAALTFAAALTAGGVAYLALAVNALSSLLAFLTWAVYLFVYTPLKKKTVWCTTVGAFPGAMPPLIGWAAARGRLDVEAAALFAILFLWQFPHFLSIAWLYREDYARARIRMLPAEDPHGEATSWQIVLATAALLPVSLAPSWLGLAGAVYFWGALGLGFGFFFFAARIAWTRSLAHARPLLRASVAYLPMLFALLLLDKR
jgi:protoheme IX farnesyltransferase